MLKSRSTPKILQSLSEDRNIVFYLSKCFICESVSCFIRQKTPGDTRNMGAGKNTDEENDTLRVYLTAKHTRVCVTLTEVVSDVLINNESFWHFYFESAASVVKTPFMLTWYSSSHNNSKWLEEKLTFLPITRWLSHFLWIKTAEKMPLLTWNYVKTAENTKHEKIFDKTQNMMVGAVHQISSCLWWVLAHINRLSKGERDIHNTNTGASRICFGVSNLQVDRRFDCAAHRLDVISAPTHPLETNERYTLDLKYTQVIWVNDCCSFATCRSPESCFCVDENSCCLSGSLWWFIFSYKGTAYSSTIDAS